MLHINRIVIDGFIAKNQRLEFNFAKGNVTVIYGINGSGKTTLLEILYAICSNNEDILQDKNVESLEIEYCVDINRQNRLNSDIEELNLKIKDINNSDEEDLYDKLELLENEKNRLEDERELLNKSIKITKNDENYDWEDKNNSEFNNQTALLLGIYRGVNKKDKIVDEPILWKFFQNSSSIKGYARELDFTTSENFEKMVINNLSKELYEFLDYTDEKKLNKKNRYIAQKIGKELNHNFSFLKIEEVEAILEEKYEQTIKKTQIKIGESLFSGVAEVMAKIKNKIDEEEIFKNLQKNQDLILKALDDNRDDFKNQIEEILQGDIDNFKNQESLIKIILSNFLNRLENETIEYNKLQLFVNEFNSFIKVNNKKVVINSKGIKIKLEDSSTHSLNKLSSGERNMLTFLATILLLGESRDFILIDEPEISLNVKWQRKILSVITKLAPDSQIIIATHSPLVARGYSQSVIGIEPKVYYE